MVVTSGGAAITRADGVLSAPTVRSSVVTMQPRAIALQSGTGVFACEFQMLRTSEDLFGALPDATVPARPEDDLVVEDRPVPNAKGSMIAGLRRRIEAAKKVEAKKAGADMIADPNLDLDLEAVLHPPAVLIGICVTSFKGSVRSTVGIGSHPDTIALGDDGFIWANAQRCGAPACRPLRISDMVGMCVDTDHRRIVFSLNGHPVISVGTQADAGDGASAAASSQDTTSAEYSRIPVLEDAPEFVGVAPASTANSCADRLMATPGGVNVGLSLDCRGVAGVNLGERSFVYRPSISAAGSV